MKKIIALQTSSYEGLISNYIESIIACPRIEQARIKQCYMLPLTPLYEFLFLLLIYTYQNPLKRLYRAFLAVVLRKYSLYSGKERVVDRYKLSYLISDIDPYLTPEQMLFLANFHGTLFEHDDVLDDGVS